MDRDTPHKSSMDKKDNATDDDAELAYDSIVTEDTVLYRAQVAVEGRSAETLPLGAEAMAWREPNIGAMVSTNSATKALRDPSDIRAKKLFNFSTKIPKESKLIFIRGVLAIADKFVVVDYFRSTLKLYTENGEFLSSKTTASKDGITKVDCNRFATCGTEYHVFLWQICGNNMIPVGQTRSTGGYTHGIHFNGTYYCLLHCFDNAVTILDACYRHIRRFVVREANGKKVEFGYDIHSDRDTHHVYIPCILNNRGILCVSEEGEVLRFIALDNDPQGITQIHGSLCVVDQTCHCVHLISKDGKTQCKLLDKRVLKKGPRFIAVNDSTEKLIIAYFEKAAITVFSLK